MKETEYKGKKCKAKLQSNLIKWDLDKWKISLNVTNKAVP